MEGREVLLSLVVCEEGKEPLTLMTPRYPLPDGAANLRRWVESQVPELSRVASEAIAGVESANTQSVVITGNHGQ